MMTTLEKKQSTTNSDPIPAHLIGALADTVSTERAWNELYSGPIPQPHHANRGWRDGNLGSLPVVSPMICPPPAEAESSRFVWPLPLNRLGLPQRARERLSDDCLDAIRHAVETYGKTSLELFEERLPRKKEIEPPSAVRVPDTKSSSIQPSSKIPFRPTVTREVWRFDRVSVDGRIKLVPVLSTITEPRDESRYSFLVEGVDGKKTKRRTETRSEKQLRWNAYLESREWSYRRLIRRRIVEWSARRMLTKEQWSSIPVRQRAAKLRELIGKLTANNLPSCVSINLEAAKSDEFRRAPKQRESEYPIYCDSDIRALRAHLSEKLTATDIENKLVGSLCCRGESVGSARDFVNGLRNGRSVTDSASYHLRVVPARTVLSLLTRFRKEV